MKFELLSTAQRKHISFRKDGIRMQENGGARKDHKTSTLIVPNVDCPAQGLASTGGSIAAHTSLLNKKYQDVLSSRLVMYILEGSLD